MKGCLRAAFFLNSIPMSLEALPEIQSQIEQFEIKSKESLESFRLEFLSKKGKVSQLLSSIGSLPKKDRGKAGQAINSLKKLAQQKFEDKQTELESLEETAFDASKDISFSVPPLATGSSHVITQTLNELKQVFLRMGFSIADGPEIEDDFHNFTALNFPPEHPARDMQDTFFIRKDEFDPSRDQVLRTHTSPVQIRLMKSKNPPIRAIMPGRVYRNEAITHKSFCLFHQIEGLYVDKKVTLADLKETLITCAKLMFGSSVKYRMRPSFFPFTEPSMEVDVWWEKNEKGQWMEILGAGMVDPNVFEAVGIDPEQYSGFAFGMGVERQALLKYGIDDIRILYENDLRFLNQFSK